MQYLKTYLKTISSRGNEKLAESISHTAEDVGNRYIKSFSFCSHEIGLLFGNVQSGKTGQMFGIMCKAADLGFPAFVLLTTDNVVLQQQTLDRVKADLTGFCVCGEHDSGLFIENSLLQNLTFAPTNTLTNTAIVLDSTKHHKHSAGCHFHVFTV